MSINQNSSLLIMAQQNQPNIDHSYWKQNIQTYFEEHDVKNISWNTIEDELWCRYKSVVDRTKFDRFMKCIIPIYAPKIKQSHVNLYCISIFEYSIYY